MILPEARREIFNRDKVAILTNYPFDGRTFTGGVETATAGLLEGLAAFSEQFDFHVIALSRDVRSHSVERRDGITFHFLAIPPVRPHVIPNIINARATVRRLNADLVHCQDNMALAVGAVLARPARKLFTIHGIKGMEAMLWEGPEYWSHSMDAILERWVRKQFDEVITISPYVDRFLPIEVKKYHVPNPVRRIFFENPRTDSGDKHVLFVGAFTRLKRPMDLLEAFAVRERNETRDGRKKDPGCPLRWAAVTGTDRTVDAGSDSPGASIGTGKFTDGRRRGDGERVAGDCLPCRRRTAHDHRRRGRIVVRVRKRDGAEPAPAAHAREFAPATRSCL